MTNMDRYVYSVCGFKTPTHKPHYFFSSGRWWRIAHNGAVPRPVIGVPWEPRMLVGA